MGSGDDGHGCRLARVLLCSSVESCGDVAKGSTTRLSLGTWLTVIDLVSAYLGLVFGDFAHWPCAGMM